MPSWYSKYHLLPCCEVLGCHTARVRTSHSHRAHKSQRGRKVVKKLRREGGRVMKGTQEEEGMGRGGEGDKVGGGVVLRGI